MFLKTLTACEVIKTLLGIHILRRNYAKTKETPKHNKKEKWLLILRWSYLVLLEESSVWAKSFENKSFKEIKKARLVEQYSFSDLNWTFSTIPSIKQLKLTRHWRQAQTYKKAACLGPGNLIQVVFGKTSPNLPAPLSTWLDRLTFIATNEQTDFIKRINKTFFFR